MALPGCSGEECSSTALPPTADSDDWLEQDVVAGFRVWQIMFMSFAAVLALVIFLCCCIRFRIPRTKQEIEADYIRKKITRKFQKHLRCIQNADMDDMDLKRALDRVRAEFKSDSDSTAPSEALSGATLSSGCNCPEAAPPQLLLVPPTADNSYCKGSAVNIGEDDAKQTQNGIGAKFASLVGNTLTKFRAKKQQTPEEVKY